MRTAFAVLAVCLLAGAQTIELKTASASPMQYYVSLPQGWTAAKTWPVVMVIESARRDFHQAATQFVNARGGMPFIVAVPLVVTNGGSGYRQAPGYRYSDADWARIEKTGGCGFDEEGIAAVAADIHSRFGGEQKYFLASWEAGGHTAWAFVFRHPESLNAAAFSGPNYQGRCVQFSSDPARVGLPVKVFLSGIAVTSAPNSYVHQQSLRAKAEGELHGFRSIAIQEIPDKPHGPLPDEILAWFQSLRTP